MLNAMRASIMRMINEDEKKREAAKKRKKNSINQKKESSLRQENGRVAIQFED
jgi:hypothetical protein